MSLPVSLPVNLPVVAPADKPALPEFKVTSCFGCLSRNRLADLEADLMVVTVMFKSRLAPVFQPLDLSSGNRIARALAKKHFAGRLGENVLLDLRAKHGPQKYIYVVGLGSFERFGQDTVCAFFRLVLDKARELQSRSVVFVIPPGRLSAAVVSLRTTAATLRCRVQERASNGGLGKLERIEIVASPQACHLIEAGLHGCGQYCQTCPDPKIPQ